MTTLLIFAAVTDFLLAAMHGAVIVIGPKGYRFFRAGERMATLAERGHWYPAVLTLCLTGVFVAWGLYALAAAGVGFDLPYARMVTLAVATIFTLRGLAIVPQALGYAACTGGEPLAPRDRLFSLGALVAGLAHGAVALG